MATITFFLLFNSFLIAAAQQREFNISRGSNLTPTGPKSSWLSPSGLYAFGFYQQGNSYAIGVFLERIPQKTVVWTAKRDDPPVSSNVTLIFTVDGRLVLQSARGQDSVISVSETAFSAAMSDSGNFMLYNSSRGIIWQSFENPTDTLLPTQRLEAGTGLISSISKADKASGIFSLMMQRDGNLVQYPTTTTPRPDLAYYATGTHTSGDNVSLNLDNDGHLYLLNATGINILNLTLGQYPTRNTTYMMKLDADGIFRVYSYDMTNNRTWSIVWSSTEDKCNPKGLCGLNGYCIMNDRESECMCLPGFDFVNKGNWTSGCQRNFVADSCGGRNGSFGYTIEELPNTIWEDASYSVKSFSIKEDCRQACLDDCNCEAAFFKDGQCKMQRLPLRFGRRQLTDSSTAFIKVGTPSTVDTAEPSGKKERFREDILIIIASLGASGLVLAIFGVVMYRYHGWTYERINYNDNRSRVEVGPLLFCYAELEKATDGFKEEIGRGAFGVVYKGIISSSQTIVAVKKLEKVLAEGEGEFQNEVKVIGKTHHKNLVRLIGYCLDGPQRLLVYEYMSNGSLADVLFSPERRPCFTERMEIACNIARGILYLHEECETQIMHCDIKPQNILMDECRHPKISDFGLAKLLKPDQSQTVTGIRGTKGYVAPEWHRKLPVTVKADVYSFGIVLLEIACCRKSVDFNLPEGEAILDQWVYDCFEAGEMYKLVGDEEVDKRQLERMVKVGLWCILDEPSLRPSMKKVLLMLEGTVDIPTPPSPTSFLSAI